MTEPGAPSRDEAPTNGESTPGAPAGGEQAARGPAPESAKQPARGRCWALLFFLMMGTVMLDQLTKSLIVGRFRLGDSVPVIANFFSITYIRNTGAAFGLLAHSAPAFRIPFFVIVPLAALLAIALIFRKIPAGDLKLSSALSLVIGGALGNLVDRLRFGYVVDFLDFHWRYEYHFPAFNVADTAICLGVGILMLDLLLQKEDGAQGKETQTHASATR